MKIEVVQAYAQIEAIKIRVLAMEHTNLQRLADGFSLAYSEQDIEEAACEIDDIIQAMNHIDL